MKENSHVARDRPIRLTLVDQAADCIREALLKGRWGGKIPSEKELVREFGVSRGTLRSALAVLFEEGILQPGGRGGRHRVTSKLKRGQRGHGARSGELVRILSPQKRFIVSGQSQRIFQVVSEALGRAGLNLEFEYHPGLWKLRRPGALLRKITALPDTAGWLLYRSTKEVQKWFSDSEIPAVVLGGRHPEIALSHAEFDFVAASRHAAGLFAARGRRRVVFLSVENATAGDHASARAFEEAAARSGLEARTVVFDDTVDGLVRAIDSLLVQHPAPDGYFVGFPNHAPATIGHLTRRGFPVPEKVSVISRMDARLLAESIPTVARYETDSERLGKGLARLIIQAVDAKRMGGPRSHIVMPEFVDGESAGRKIR